MLARDCRTRLGLSAAALMMVFATGALAEQPFVHDGPIQTSPISMWECVAVDPPPTFLMVGDDAPSFCFLGTDGGWHDFSELPGGCSLLMVFGATESDLAELESARSLFSDLHVCPVVVMDRRTGSSAKLARRLGLTCCVIADPKCAIADLYNSIDPLSQRHAPSFFVLDEKRTIRAIGHGFIPPALKMLAMTARGLGRPLPESAWSAFGG